MRVKVKRTEQNRFTWNAQDFSPGEEVDIPDAYAQEYVDKGYVEEVKHSARRSEASAVKAQKKSAAKRRASK